MSSGKYVSARCTIDNPSQFVLIILGGGLVLLSLFLLPVAMLLQLLKPIRQHRRALGIHFFLFAEEFLC